MQITRIIVVVTLLSLLFMFVIAVVKLTKLMAREQRLSSIVDMVKKNPKDCVLAVHGGRPNLQYIKCHPNFLAFLRNYDGGEN